MVPRAKPIVEVIRHITIGFDLSEIELLGVRCGSEGHGEISHYIRTQLGLPECLTDTKERALKDVLQHGKTAAWVAAKVDWQTHRMDSLINEFHGFRSEMRSRLAGEPDEDTPAEAEATLDDFLAD